MQIKNPPSALQPAPIVCCSGRVLFPFPTLHSLDAFWGCVQCLSGKQRVPLNYCWVQPKAPFCSGATHRGTAFPAVRAPGEHLLLELPAVGALFHWESTDPASSRQFPWIPLPGAARLSFQSLLPVSAIQGLGSLCMGARPHSQGGGSFAATVTRASQPSTSSGGGGGGLPLSETPPLTSLFVISSVFLRQNMSNQLHFSCFFSVTTHYFSCKSIPCLGARALPASC